MVEARAERGVTFWRAVYAQHAAAVLAFLARRMARREDAEDLLQETFVRAIRASESLREGEKVRSYLLSIAHHLMLNHYRRKRERLFSEGSGSFAGELERLPETTSPSPEAPLVRGELVSHLAAQLALLTPTLRQAFQLGVLEKVPYLEIAERTGWSLAQVKVNIYRARKQVIAGLAPVLPGHGGVS